MPSEQERVGVCVVRVEVQPYGRLITVQINPDLGQAPTADKATTTDTEAAVTLVREFLTAFIADAPSA